MKPAALACAAIVVIAAAAQTPPGRVVVHIVAKDAAKLTHPHVAASEVELLVDDVRVPVEGIGTQAPALSLVVLIDTSNSVMRPVMGLGVTSWSGPVSKALDRGLERLHEGDRVRIASIGGRDAPAALTSDRATLRRQKDRALDRPEQERAGPSPIWDAIAAASRSLRDQPGLRAVVTFTDTRASGNTLGMADVAMLATADNVVTYFITPAVEQYIVQGDDVAARVRPGAFAEQLATFTGGTCVYVRGTNEKTMTTALAQVLDDLHATRALTFTSPVRDGAPHRVVVRSTTGVTIVAPQAFIAPR
jgi:hypothetical protein